MKKVSTNWCQATDNKINAFEAVKNAIMSGRNAWIEKRENVYENEDGTKGCAFPLTTINSGLNNPFNWTMLYGTIHPNDEEQNFLNDTEKDLFNNYVVLYSTEEAREHYINTGEVIDGLNNGIGICTPVRIEDANKTRDDGYEYKGRTIKWKPLGMKYRIPDPNITEVYVVVSNDETVDASEVLTKLKKVLEELA